MIDAAVVVVDLERTIGKGGNPVADAACAGVALGLFPETPRREPQDGVDG